MNSPTCPRPPLLLLTLCAAASLLALPPAFSQSADPATSIPSTSSGQSRDPEAAATKRVNDAVAVVKKMESDPTMRKVLESAKGVFIVPAYGRAALGVGGQGGAGVLLVRKSSDTWSDPAFYNIGGINVGAQVGAEIGSIAFALNNEKAVQRFTGKNNFSLSADAGLTVMNWAKLAEGSTGAGDVTAWAGTRGLFGNVATVGINDIRFNQRVTNAYYHQNQNLSAMDVINGKVKNPGADDLKQALAELTTGTASGASSGGKTTAPSRKH